MQDPTPEFVHCPLSAGTRSELRAALYGGSPSKPSTEAGMARHCGRWGAFAFGSEGAADYCGRAAGAWRAGIRRGGSVGGENARYLTFADVLEAGAFPGGEDQDARLRASRKMVFVRAPERPPSDQDPIILALAFTPALPARQTSPGVPPRGRKRSTRANASQRPSSRRRAAVSPCEPRPPAKTTQRRETSPPAAARFTLRCRHRLTPSPSARRRRPLRHKRLNRAIRKL